MKTATWIPALVLLAACGGKEGGSSNGDRPRVQARTERGVPKGGAVHATIGAQGGELASVDGRVTVRIPAGALDSDVDVSVQPITNLAPGAKGDAFRLEPSGVVFSKPVAIEFRYGEDDLPGTAPEALFAAYQDDEGRWWLQGGRSLDPVARTIRVTTSHFSDWSAVAGWTLSPDFGHLKARRKQELQVIVCGDASPDEEVPLALYPCEPATGAIDAVEGWAVNGVSGGSAESGTVQATGPHRAEYTAPGSPPANNPVAVSAEVSAALGKILLVANLQIEADGCGDMGGLTVPCEWSGATTYQFRDPDSPAAIIRVKADSTFRFEDWFPGEDRLAFYVAVSGTVELLEYKTQSCTVSVSPSTYAIASLEPDEGSLTIDYSSSPPRLNHLSGVSLWPATLRSSGAPDCVPSIESAFASPWAENFGTRSEVIGGTFAGEHHEETEGIGIVDTTWSFQSN